MYVLVDKVELQSQSAIAVLPQTIVSCACRDPRLLSELNGSMAVSL